MSHRTQQDDFVLPLLESRPGRWYDSLAAKMVVAAVGTAVLTAAAGLGLLVIREPGCPSLNTFCDEYSVYCPYVDWGWGLFSAGMVVAILSIVTFWFSSGPDSRDR